MPKGTWGSGKWLPGWPGKMAGSLIDHNSALGSEQMYVVDQALCAHATAFVGTFGSGFSAEIHFERRRAHEADSPGLGDSVRLSASAKTEAVALSEAWGHY